MMDFPHPQKVVVVVVGAVISLSGAFFAGVWVGDENGLSATAGTLSFGFDGISNEPPEGVDTTPLWRAWNVLNDRFVPAATTSQVTDQEKLWGAIQGLAESVNDPYTTFLPPADNKQFTDDISGNFEGVGMEIGKRDGVLTVISPLEGTPAKRAGIESGDQILKIDDVATDGLSVDEAVKLIRGEGGTEVVLTIAREGERELLEIPVVRAVIEIPTLKTNLRDDGIFIIELYNFSAPSSGKFRDAIREFSKSGSRKLILDLRGNPGGFLEAAVDAASWFLPLGKVVVSEDFGGNANPNIYRSKGYNALGDDLKMVILVNQGSASASEILAGALQEHGIATLVGMPTFGKGSVQELVEITDNTSLKVTIARWLTPNGVSISDGGLTPDVEVEVTKEDIENQTDPQLEKAIEILSDS